MLKTHIFEKVRKLSGEEKVLAFFSRFIECDKPRRTIYKVLQGILTNTVEVMRQILYDLRGC